MFSRPRATALLSALLALVALTSAAFESATYLYDSSGRLSEIVYSNGERVIYTYDVAGNVTAQTIETTPPPGGDLDVAVTGSFDQPLTLGLDTVLSFVVGNYGPSSATAVSLSTTIPSELTVVSTATTMGSCTGTTTVTCDVAALVTGSSFQVDITVTPTMAWSGDVIASVSTTESDYKSANNTDQVALSTGSFELTLSAANVPAVVNDGDTFTYDVDIANTGNHPANGFQLILTPDTLHTPVSATITDGNCTVAATVVCDLASLSPGGAITVSTQVTSGRVGSVALGMDLSGTEPFGGTYSQTATHTHWVNPPTGPIVPLTLGVIDSGEYGNNWGTNEHGTIVVAQFDADASSNLEMGVVGHDVDYADEVKVILNGTDIGFLATGPNNGNSDRNILSIPSTAQVDGTNEIRFVQNRNPTWKWGVTNLELQPEGAFVDVMLTFNTLDTGQYGHNYGPADYGRDVLVGFTSTGTDVVLDVVGYDIDYADEISVTVNGVFHSYLTVGPNNGLNGGDQISIPASAQVPGINNVLFYNRSATWKWGITNLKVRDP